jgi:hypothetical protein
LTKPQGQKFFPPPNRTSIRHTTLSLARHNTVWSGICCKSKYLKQDTTIIKLFQTTVNICTNGLSGRTASTDDKTRKTHQPLLPLYHITYRSKVILPRSSVIENCLGGRVPASYRRSLSSQRSTWLQHLPSSLIPRAETWLDLPPNSHECRIGPADKHPLINRHATDLYIGISSRTRKPYFPLSPYPISAQCRLLKSKYLT